MECRDNKLTSLHESHAPVNALGEALAQQCLGNVSLWEQNRTNEVGVVDRFKNDFDIALQKTGLNEVAGFLSEVDTHTWVGFAFRIELEAWALIIENKNTIFNSNIQCNIGILSILKI